MHTQRLAAVNTASSIATRGRAMQQATTEGMMEVDSAATSNTAGAEPRAVVPGQWSCQLMQGVAECVADVAVQQVRVCVCV